MNKQDDVAVLEVLQTWYDLTDAQNEALTRAIGALEREEKLRELLSDLRADTQNAYDEGERDKIDILGAVTLRLEQLLAEKAG
ncbi:MAG: hypothetical protein JSR70_08530 [Proteobacteria bacterium]|nr:hypothetical protein [Pseudomonadota bacterium]